MSVATPQAIKATSLEIASAAGLKQGHVRSGEIYFHCPNHDDQHASLRINPEKNAWQCDPCSAGGTAYQLIVFIAGFDRSDRRAVAQWCDAHGLRNGTRNRNGNGTGRQIVATYPYHDESGHILYEVVRFNPKGFAQRKPDGTWSMDGVRRVLYRLPEVLQADEIYIPEGEKDCDNLGAIGLTATCNSGGVGKWKPEYAAFFKPHQHVVILPDNDEPGRQHAQQVAQSLR